MSVVMAELVPWRLVLLLLWKLLLLGSIVRAVAELISPVVVGAVRMGALPDIPALPWTLDWGVVAALLVLLLLLALPRLLEVSAVVYKTNRNPETVS